MIYGVTHKTAVAALNDHEQQQNCSVGRNTNGDS